MCEKAQQAVLMRALFTRHEPQTQGLSIIIRVLNRNQAIIKYHHREISKKLSNSSHSLIKLKLWLEGGQQHRTRAMVEQEQDSKNLISIFLTKK